MLIIEAWAMDNGKQAHTNNASLYIGAFLIAYDAIPAYNIKLNNLPSHNNHILFKYNLKYHLDLKYNFRITFQMLSLFNYISSYDILIYHIR